uniref:Uncharacterized protein n=1 Tax=Acrobeloides nanus TaxID=290746 RepID=A0A914DRS6_9BILA
MEESEQQMNFEFQQAKKAEKLNSEQPRARPFKDRIEYLRAHNLLVAKNKAKTNSNVGSVIKKTWITGQRHCCKKPMSELQPITLSQMKVPMVHTGHYLPCRVVTTEANVVVATEVFIEDTNGHIEKLSLYNFNCDLDDSTWLKAGTILFVKEPYIKFGSVAHTTMIRVDSPSDVVFVDETNKDLLSQAGVLAWYKPERFTFEMLKKKANELFKSGDYEEALKFYHHALEIHPESEVIHLNMAATLLQLERFYEAYEEAYKAVRGDLTEDLKDKALFRMGKAAYGMRIWQKAFDHFESLDASRLPSAVVELAKVKSRLHEATTGKYDLRKIYKKPRQKMQFFDVADYTGPVKVADIPGKGKGLVVTEDVKKGTLLLVSKAYALSYDKNEDKTLCVGFNMMTKTCVSTTQVHVIIETIQKLKKNPQTAKELYSLYAGDLDRDEKISAGVIDAGRIERICLYNCFGSSFEYDREK